MVKSPDWIDRRNRNLSVRSRKLRFAKLLGSCFKLPPNNSISSLRYHSAFVICVPNSGPQGGRHFPCECHNEGQRQFNATELGAHKHHLACHPCFVLRIVSTETHPVREYFKKPKFFFAAQYPKVANVAHRDVPGHSRYPD